MDRRIGSARLHDLTSDLPPDEHGDHPDHDPATVPHRRPPSQRTLRIVVLLPIIAYAAAPIGAALFPSLEKDNPALLLILHARLRALIAVVNQVNTVYFFVVGSLRMLVTDPLFFLLGYWYGDAIVSWMEQRTPSTGKAVRRYEKLFRDAAYPVGVLAPSSIVCALAGSAGMRPVVFMALNTLGTVGRVVAVKIFGKRFEEPIDAIVTWISDNRLFLLPITIGLVVFAVGRDVVRGRRDIAVLEEIAEDAGEQAGDQAGEG